MKLNFDAKEILINSELFAKFLKEFFILPDQSENIIKIMIEKKSFKINVENLLKNPNTDPSALVTYNDFSKIYRTPKYIRNCIRELKNAEIIKDSYFTFKKGNAVINIKYFYFPFDSFSEFFSKKVTEIEFHLNNYRKFFEEVDKKIR